MRKEEDKSEQDWVEGNEEAYADENNDNNDNDDDESE